MKPLDKGLWFSLALVLLAMWQRGGQAPLVSPAPKAERIHAVLVHESERPAWLGSLIVQVQQKNLAPHRFESLDKDTLPQSLRSAIGEYDAAKLPTMFLLDAYSYELLGSMPIGSGTTASQICDTVKVYAQ